MTTGFVADGLLFMHIGYLVNRQTPCLYKTHDHLSFISTSKSIFKFFNKNMDFYVIFFFVLLENSLSIENAWGQIFQV